MVLDLLFQPAVAGFCPYYDEACVDPIAQTAYPLDLQPLFPGPLSLFYAYDASSSSSSSSSNNLPPSTKSAFWLRYDGIRVNRSAITTNRTLEIGMRMGNFTGTPGGGHNGCDGIIGPECADTIEDSLQEAIYQLLLSSGDGDHTNPLQTVLGKMQASPPANFSCVPSFFSVQNFPVMREFSLSSFPPFFFFFPSADFFCCCSICFGNGIRTNRSSPRCRIELFPVESVVHAIHDYQFAGERGSCGRDRSNSQKH